MKAKHRNVILVSIILLAVFCGTVFALESGNGLHQGSAEEIVPETPVIQKETTETVDISAPLEELRAGIREDIAQTDAAEAIKKLEAFESEFGKQIRNDKNALSGFNSIRNSFVSSLYDNLYSRLLEDPEYDVDLEETDGLLQSPALTDENRSYWHLSILEDLVAGYRCPNLSGTSWQEENGDLFLSLSRNGEFHILLQTKDSGTGSSVWQEQSNGTYEVSLNRNRIMLDTGDSLKYLEIHTSGQKNGTWLYDTENGTIYR